MKKIMIIAILALLTACAGNHCIKVGGSYDGVTGELEYCYDETSSKETGITVLSGDSEKAVLLNEKQVSKLLEKVAPEQKSLLNVSPMKRLSELVK